MVDPKFRGIWTDEQFSEFIGKMEACLQVGYTLTLNVAGHGKWEVRHLAPLEFEIVAA